jgi:CO dehydrogenase maturation factor
MKIAVSGKGGVGKTTVSAQLAARFALLGRSVIAVDADPDANLAAALGIPDGERITPLSEMHDMILERTGAKDAYGGYFKLNPHVEDIPAKFARTIGNVHLLVLGGVSKGGAGCICPATAVLKALMVHLVLGRDDVVIMDMEAGIEHLGRSTAGSMDALIVVVDEGPWSVQTALRVRDLAADIGLKKVFAVANRVTEPANLSKIALALDGIPLIGHLPYDKRFLGGALRTVDGQIQAGESVAQHGPAVEGILSELTGRVGG